MNMSLRHSTNSASLAFDNYHYGTSHNLNKNGINDVSMLQNAGKMKPSQGYSTNWRQENSRILNEDVLQFHSVASVVPLINIPARSTLRKSSSQLPQKSLCRSNTSTPSSSRSSSDRKSLPASDLAAGDRFLGHNGFKVAAICTRQANTFCSEGYTHIPQVGLYSYPTNEESGGFGNATEKTLAPSTTKPFEKWLSTLRRRHQPLDLLQATHRWPIDGEVEPQIDFGPTHKGHIWSYRRTSTSDSSSHAFVTALKSATVTIAETSATQRTWITGRLGHLRLARFSKSERGSVDSTATFLEPGIDDMSWTRSVQRRKILEELIESEESYIADLKILMNVSNFTHYQMFRTLSSVRFILLLSFPPLQGRLISELRLARQFLRFSSFMRLYSAISTKSFPTLNTMTNMPKNLPFSYPGVMCAGVVPTVGRVDLKNYDWVGNFDTRGILQGL